MPLNASLLKEHFRPLLSSLRCTLTYQLPLAPALIWPIPSTPLVPRVFSLRLCTRTACIVCSTPCLSVTAFGFAALEALAMAVGYTNLPTCPLLRSRILSFAAPSGGGLACPLLLLDSAACIKPCTPPRSFAPSRLILPVNMLSPASLVEAPSTSCINLLPLSFAHAT